MPPRERSRTGDAGVIFSATGYKRADLADGNAMVLLDTPQDHQVSLQRLTETVDALRPKLPSFVDQDIYIELGPPALSPDGPILPIDECEPTKKALTILLNELADGLTARGAEGVLRPARQASVGHFSQSRPGPGAIFLMPMNTDDEIQERWRVEPATAEAALRRLADWACELDGDVYFRQEAAQFRVAPASVGDLLTATVARLGRFPTGIAVTTGASRSRVLNVGHDGFIGIVDQDTHGDVTQQFAGLTNLVDSMSDLVNTAFVRKVWTAGLAWENALGMRPPVVPIAETFDPNRAFAWGASRNLRTDYVYDAFAHQVLTGSQFAKITPDPSRWSVTELGNDCFAVTHLQPEAWFGGDDEGTVPFVDTDVLAAARADFADAIIRPEHLDMTLWAPFYPDWPHR